MGTWLRMSSRVLLEKISKIDYRKEAIRQAMNRIHMNFRGMWFHH